MKRKLLFFLAMMVMLVCVFAISVSADNLIASSGNEYGATVSTIDKHEASKPSTIDSISRVVLLASDGTYYTFPAYYILQDSATFGWKQNAEVTAALGYTQSSVTNDFRPYVVRIEIPEGVTATNPNSNGGGTVFEDAKKLIEVTIPSTMTVIGDYTFNRASNLATIEGFDSFMQRATRLGTLMLNGTAWGEGFDLVIPAAITSIPGSCFQGTKISSVTFHEGVETIGPRAFQSCKNITAVILPEGLKALKNHVFADCSGLASVNTSKCTQLQEIGEYCFEKISITSFDFTPFAEAFTTIGNGVFNYCTKMTSVISYEKLDRVTKIGDNMFYNCPLSEIKMPKNITFIGNYAFFLHKSVQAELRIPNGVTSIGNHAFARNGIGGASELKIYLSAGLTTIVNNYTFENWQYAEMYIPACLTNIITGFCNNTLKTGVVYYYTGAENGFTIDATNNAAMLGAEWISVDDFTGASNEKNYIVYGYNHCDAFYGGKHTEKTQDNNPCILVDCENCNVKNLYVGNESTHSETTTIVYESYDKDGSKIVYCTNEGCKHNVTEKVSALFTCLGYSAPEDGRGGIAIGFTVNNVAIKEYTEATGKTLKCGVFAVVKDKLGNNDVFADDGTVADGVINADIADEFVAFELKIEGFTDEYKATKLAIGAYVAVTEDEATEYSYMQVGTPLENEKYCFVSYNDIVSTPSTDEENAQ